MLTIIDKNKLCQAYLKLLYLDQAAKVNHEGQGKLPNFYGEILFEGIEKILQSISLGKNDVFIDLGSGMGKIVNQVFLQTNVQEVLGVELISELHNIAQLSAERIKHELPEFFLEDRQLIFYNADFLKLPFPSATVIFVNPVTFPYPVFEALGKLLNHHSAHTIVSIRPLPHFNRLKFRKTIRVECSWDTALCYVYN